MNESKRIAKNTIILYIRMLFVMAITIYTSRVVLEILGIEDYGVQNAVGGIVGMFSLISGSMSNSVMRFITYELGKGNKTRLANVFISSVNVMLILAILVFIIGELLGVWFLNHKMSIPEDRMVAANWVFHLSLLTFAINIMSVPYNATIVAYERMNIYAFISVLEVILKLVIVYLLTLSNIDRLILYSILLFSIAVLIRLIYWIYCRKSFKECEYKFVYDRDLLKKMASFAGWNFFGQSTAVISNQGVNILMNLFFGVLVNAARGISGHVQSAVMQFVNSFTVALNPQITKSYASGDFQYMHKLIYSGAKISYYLTLLITIPLFIEAETVLKLWLGTVPDYSVTFVQLTLVFVSISVITGTLIPSLHATGKIKKYMVIIGFSEIVIFSICLLAYKLGFSPESSYHIYNISYICLIFVRLFLIKDLIHISIREYCQKVLFRIALVTICAFTISTFVINLLEATSIRLVYSLILCTCISCVSEYLLGFDIEEKQIIKKFLYRKFNNKQNGK